MKAHVGVLRGLGSEDQSSRRLRVCSGREVGICCVCSGVKGLSVDLYLEMCILQAEALYLKQPTSRQAMSSDRFAQSYPHWPGFSCLVKSSGENNPGEHVALIKKQEKHIFEIQSQRALPPRQMCALLPPMRKRWGFSKGAFCFLVTKPFQSQGYLQPTLKSPLHLTAVMECQQPAFVLERLALGSCWRERTDVIPYV